MFGNFTWILLWAVLPTLVYLGIGLYILSLEQKKGPGYKLPALIYFISVPSIIVIVIALNFSMNYETGRFESADKPVGYELYKFLVLKDIIPRSGEDIKKTNLVTDEKILKSLNTRFNKRVNHTFENSPNLNIDFNINFSKIDFVYYSDLPKNKLLSFNIYLDNSGIFSPGDYQVDVYLNDIEYIGETEIYKFKFVITSNKGEVTKANFNILKDFQNNFNLSIEHDGGIYERVDFEDHKGIIHSIHIEKARHNIFSYVYDIKNNSKPSFIAGFLENISGELDIGEVVDDYYKSKEIDIYKSIKDNKFQQNMFELIAEEDDTLFVVSSDRNYAGKCFQKNIDRMILEKCAMAAEHIQNWRHNYELLFLEKIFPKFKEAFENIEMNNLNKIDINNQILTKNIISLIDNHHKNKFKELKKYILGDNKNLYKKLNLNVDDFIEIFPDNTVTISLNYSKKKFENIEKEQYNILFQETDLLSNHITGIRTYKNSNYLRIFLVKGPEFTFREEFNIPNFFDVDKEYRYPEIIKDKIKKFRNLSLTLFEYEDEMYQFFLIKENQQKTFFALYSVTDDKKIIKLLTSNVIDNNYFFKDYVRNCNENDESNCEKYSQLISYGLTDFDYQPYINNAKKIINKISINDEIIFNENRMDFASKDKKEEIASQASLNDRSKYESILKNLSVGEILKFELEEKNTKINVQLFKSKKNIWFNTAQENMTETFFDVTDRYGEKSYSKSTFSESGIKYYTYDSQDYGIEYFENINESDSLYEYLKAKYGYEAIYRKDNKYIVWGLNKSFDSLYNLMVQLDAQKKDGKLTRDEIEEIYIDKFISDYLNYVIFGDGNLKFALNADQKKDEESKDILVFNKNKNNLINNSSFTGLCNDQEKYNKFYKNNYEEKDCLALLKTLIREKLPAFIIKEYKEYENLLVQKINTKQDDKLITNEKYYALVIGNNNYQYLEKLDAAENDATVIADILENKYGFEVELLLNGDYSTTVNSIFNMTKKLKENDNLLIYYAGHGELDKSENRGYWLPVNASTKSRAEWISNQRIVDRVKATKAKHVLLMVDSCFSGSLMRGGELSEENETIDKKYIERLKKKKTRLVITSGGNEPVVDSDGGNHSLFALKLIDTLKNNENVINSQILFENIRRYVVANADQTPERAMVHKTGHDGGDFLFFPK